MNVPRLRFPGFEGEWSDHKLEEIIKLSSQKFNPEKEAANIRSIELEHLSSNSGELLGYNEGEKLGSIKNRFNKGDVLFGKLRPYLRKYLKAPFDGVCSSEIWVLNGTKVTDDFLHVMVQTEVFMDLVNVSSGSKMPRSDWKVVSGGRFHIPAITEQDQVSRMFNTIGGKVSMLSKKKSLLEQYKKGMMQKIFNQEVRFKDDDGREFGEWEVTTLGDCLDYEQPTKYLVASTEYDDSFEIPVLTAGKTFLLGFTDETAGIYTEGLPVIIFDDFTTASQYVDFPFKAKSSAMKILKAKSSVNIKYVYEFMQEIKFEIGGHGRHWISVFSQLEIPLPSPKEQTKIANFLSAIDDKINVVAKQIEKIEAWKKGLLGEMLV